MTPIYNSNSTIPHHRRNSTAHKPLLLPLFPARPAKQPLPREIHTSRQVYPLNYSEISTSLSTCRRSNDFCATRHNTARPIYFYAIIYIIRTSTVICSDDIYIYIYICGDIYIRSVTERQGLALPERRKDEDHQQCFRFLLFVFCFFFTAVWSPQVTLLTISSLLRHVENLGP